MPETTDRNGKTKNSRMFTDKDYLDARFNEVKSQLEEIKAAKLVTNEECTTRHEKVNADLAVLTKFQNILEGKASQNAVIWVGGATVVSIALALWGLLMR
jgi:hypothetical protein